MPKAQPRRAQIVESLTTTPSSRKSRELAIKLAFAIDNQSPRMAAAIVTELGSAMKLDADYVSALGYGLETSDWSEVGRHFVAENFYGSASSYLVLAPFEIVRGGRKRTLLSMSAGEVMPHARRDKQIARAARALLGPLQQPMPRVVPVRPWVTAGNIGGERGEAFLVPSAWKVPDSFRGPAINDMRGQAARLDSCGWGVLKKIFGRSTATWMKSKLAPVEGWSIRSDEYAFHEWGHALGVGMNALADSGMLEHPWNRGVEEVRADWVSFVLAPKVVGYQRAGKIFLSNLVTRFGIDAHRRGGLDADHDVIATVLTLDRLLRLGVIESHGRRLAMTTTNFEELGRVAEFLGAEGVELTRAVARADSMHAVDPIYAGVGAHMHATRVLFDTLIRAPARGAYRNLK